MKEIKNNITIRALLIILSFASLVYLAYRIGYDFGYNQTISNYLKSTGS